MPYSCTQDLTFIKIRPQWAKPPKKQSVGGYFWQRGIVFWVSN